MGHSAVSRFETIQASKNEHLYSAVKYSALGSIVAAYVLFSTFEVTTQSYLVCACLYAVYIARWLDSLAFKKDPDAAERCRYWQRRFRLGALSAAVVWSSTMWFIYPSDPGYQCLLVLTLTGVAGGSLASLSYDRLTPLLFQIIIFASIELRLLLAGDPFSLNIAFFNIFIFIFLLSCSKDVSSNFQQLLRLRLDSEEHNQSLIRTAEKIARVGYWQWDRESESIELSKNLAQMWGFDGRTITLDEWMDVVHADDKERLLRELEADNGPDNDCAVEYRMKVGMDADRVMNQITRSVIDSDGSPMLLGTVQDITNIRSAEQKIYRMAYYDELTGLSNRAHFLEQLKMHVALARRNNNKFALVFVDLDDFKGVNDSYGHEVGDRYLRVFADYIRDTIRDSDVTARLGGDEFCIVLPNISDRAEVARITESCLRFSNTTIEIGNHRIQPKMSVGVSIYPDDGADESDLLRSADMAMYSVKQDGKHGYRFFEPHMVSETAERLLLEASLRVAIDNNQFELWYQPKVGLDDLRLSGVEALIRWQHPEKGVIPPDVFINTAERVGMISEIGNWVLRTACLQMREWRDAGLSLQVAVNISGAHFIEDDFIETVVATVEEYGVEASNLELEITESMTRDPVQHSAICKRLREAGVRIAIDDFGTGYSSLSVLDKLEVDTLKIDRSFISGLPDDQSSVILVQAIMELSLGFGYDVVAEGVETQAQLQHLKELGCPYLQGYYFSKPVTAEHIPPMLEQEWSYTKAA